LIDEGKYFDALADLTGPSLLNPPHFFLVRCSMFDVAGASPCRHCSRLVRRSGPLQPRLVHGLWIAPDVAPLREQVVRRDRPPGPGGVKIHGSTAAFRSRRRGWNPQSPRPPPLQSRRMNNVGVALPSPRAGGAHKLPGCVSAELAVVTERHADRAHTGAGAGDFAVEPKGEIPSSGCRRSVSALGRADCRIGRGEEDIGGWDEIESAPRWR